MNWEAIGAVGEIVGALGVISSLAYLASQIRTACAVFGMTPADRSRVSAPRFPEENPFSRL